MYSDNHNGSRTASARGYMALFAIMLAMGLASLASPAAAAPFAYVTDLNAGQAVVLVIDTATNTVMTAVPSGVTNTIFPIELAVAPDGKHVYVLPGSRSPGD
jgi:DNA-binding beta-propeller fold protein YncE